MTDFNFDNWEKRSLDHKKIYAQRLSKIDKKATLRKLPQLHEEAFAQIDCLSCARCCKNYSPRFKMPDIKRIAKFLGVKETKLITNYLHMDEEGDYVVNTTPCPFLQSDNSCGIYEVRPSDCARFPYTDEDVLFKRKNITLKNAEFCPAVFYVLEKLFV